MGVEMTFVVAPTSLHIPGWRPSPWEAAWPSLLVAPLWEGHLVTSLALGWDQCVLPSLWP